MSRWAKSGESDRRLRERRWGERGVSSRRGGTDGDDGGKGEKGEREKERGMTGESGGLQTEVAVVK